jgi:hypothetical protein
MTVAASGVALMIGDGMSLSDLTEGDAVPIALVRAVHYIARVLSDLRPRTVRPSRAFY